MTHFFLENQPLCGDTTKKSPQWRASATRAHKDVTCKPCLKALLLTQKSSRAFEAYRLRLNGHRWSKIAEKVGCRSAVTAEGRAHDFAKTRSLEWSGVMGQSDFSHLSVGGNSVCGNPSTVQEFESRISFQDLVQQEGLLGQILSDLKKYTPVNLPEEEWEDLLWDTLVDIAKDGRGFPSAYGHMNVWVRRRAITRLRKMGSDLLLRNLYGVRTGNIPGEAVRTKKVVDPDTVCHPSTPVDEWAADRERWDNVKKSLRILVPGAGDRYVRISAYMAEGYSVKEIGNLENVSRNRAASLMGDVRWTLRRARALAVDATRILEYLKENPWSTRQDILKDFSPTKCRALLSPEDMEKTLGVLVDLGFVGAKMFKHRGKSHQGFQVLRYIQMDVFGIHDTIPDNLFPTYRWEHRKG